jgi:four helix bundle protein
MAKVVRRHQDLQVWQDAFELSHDVFVLSQRFPKEETYSLTDQIRRSSRSVTANIAEAWPKRRYPLAFVAKLVDSVGEAAETQDWLAHAAACGYIDAETCDGLIARYDRVAQTLESMQFHAASWARSARKFAEPIE